MTLLTTNPTNPDLTISNNTSSLFLGTAQRPWMPSNPQSVPPTHPHPTTHVRRPSVRRIPTTTSTHAAAAASATVPSSLVIQSTGEYPPQILAHNPSVAASPSDSLVEAPTLPMPIQPMQVSSMEHPNTSATITAPAPLAATQLPTLTPLPVVDSVVPSKRPSILDQPVARRTRSRTEATIQLPTPSPHNEPIIPQDSTPWLQRYNAAMGALQSTKTRTIDQEPVIDSQRLDLFRDACNIDDVFYITTHAILCLWGSGRKGLLDPLSLTDEQWAGVAIMNTILGSWRHLTKEVANMFLHFADPSSRFSATLFLNPNLEHVKVFLSFLNARFMYVRSLAMNRGYPPHPQEVRSWFRLPSLILQRAIYISILRDMSPDNHYTAMALDAFHQQVFAPTPFNSDQHLSQIWSSRFSILKGHHARNALAAQQAARLLHQHSPTVIQQRPALPSQYTHPATPFLPGTAPAQNARPTPVDGPSDVARPHFVNQSSTSQGINMPPSVTNPIAPLPSPSPQFMHPPQQVEFSAGFGSFTPLQYHTHAPPPAMPYHLYAPPSQQTTTTPTVRNQRSGAIGPPRTAPPMWDHSRQPQPTHVRGQPPQTPSASRALPDRFFPHDRRHILPLLAQPAPGRTAIHQAEVHSPDYDRNLGSPDEESFRYYRHVEDIIMMPTRIDSSSGLISWKLELPSTLMADKVHRTTVGEFGFRSCLVSDGSTQFRLKCIKRELSEDLDGWSDEHSAAAPNTWPKFLSVSINGDFKVDFRRKAHYGVDISTDVTDLLHDGPNDVKVCVNFTPQEESLVYYVGLEIIRIASHKKVASMPQLIPSKNIKSSILHALSRKGQEDDDLVIVDPVISIDLVDPFMSKLWATPVRGNECQHRECFDLEAFLLSRTSRVKGSAMTNPDQWKCPICKKDARPQKLVIDGFLREVREQLDAQHLLDTKAILVKEDGSWEVKSDVPPPTTSKSPEYTATEGGDKKVSSNPAKMDGAPSTPQLDTIIILDEDT